MYEYCWTHILYISNSQQLICTAQISCLRFSCVCVIKQTLTESSLLTYQIYGPAVYLFKQCVGYMSHGDILAVFYMIKRGTTLAVWVNKLPLQYRIMYNLVVCTRPWEMVYVHIGLKILNPTGMKEANVLFNDTLNTFYLWLYIASENPTGTSALVVFFDLPSNILLTNLNKCAKLIFMVGIHMHNFIKFINNKYL